KVYKSTKNMHKRPQLQRIYEVPAHLWGGSDSPLIAVAGSLLSGAILAARKPERNISAHRHPNLAAAQRFCDQAFEKISAAQVANEFDISGHAAKAKELLEQAGKELKEAAEAAHKNAK